MSAINPPATLRSAVLPVGRLMTAVLLVAGVGVHAAAAQLAVPLPFTPVPITLQSLSVLLLAAAYGPRLAAATFASYLGVGLLGAPVFSLGRGGLAIFSTPTAGYLLGMLAATVVVGYLARRSWDRHPVSMVAAMTIGTALVYAGGVAWWLVLGFDLTTALSQGVLPFLPGDAVKVALAAGLLPGAWALTRKLQGSQP